MRVGTILVVIVVMVIRKKVERLWMWDCGDDYGDKGPWDKRQRVAIMTTGISLSVVVRVCARCGVWQNTGTFLPDEIEIR
jgi:hypothetical protein